MNVFYSGSFFSLSFSSLILQLSTGILLPFATAVSQFINIHDSGTGKNTRIKIENSHNRQQNQEEFVGKATYNILRRVYFGPQPGSALNIYTFCLEYVCCLLWIFPVDVN